jgi:copper resistance protein B
MSYSLNAVSQTEDAHASHGQDNKVPEDARDPHAYSGGYSRTEGLYRLPGVEPLRLMDTHYFWSVQGDRLEWLNESEHLTFDVSSWAGTTFNRLVLSAEGEVAEGEVEESSTELLWRHALTAYFDLQAGLRFDQFEVGRDQQWLAVGIQGLAPYWFETSATVYLRESGHTAFNLELEYDALLTQRLVLQPRLEMNLHGKEEALNGVGSGLSDLAFGLRLRYEISRQFAPYIGVEWLNTYGDTADFRRRAEQDTSESQFLAGLKFWF